MSYGWTLLRPEWVNFLVETLYCATCTVGVSIFGALFGAVHATVVPLKAQLVTTCHHHINSHKLLLQHMCSVHCCDAIAGHWLPLTRLDIIDYCHFPAVPDKSLTCERMWCELRFFQHFDESTFSLP